MHRFYRGGATLLEVAVVVGLTGAMMGLLLPAISSAIANAQGSHCRNNLARLAQAVNMYHDAKGKFPPSGQVQVLNSGTFDRDNIIANWVILTLPYLGEQALYDSVNWATLYSSTSGAGLTHQFNGQATYSYFTGTEVHEMRCPADSHGGVRYQINRNSNQFSPTKIWQYYARGNYMANACLMPNYNYGTSLPTPAPGCGGPDQWAWNGPTSWRTRGIMGVNSSLSRGQVTDGTSKTVLLGETRAGIIPEDPRGVWADGRPAASSAWYHLNGPNYCADDLGQSEMSSFLLALAPGNTALAHQLAAQQCMDMVNASHESFRYMGTFRSQHSGGIFVAMADSSVRFVSDSVENGTAAILGMGPFNYSLDTNDSHVLPAILTWERLNASGDGLILDDSTDPNYSSTVTPFILGDMNGDGVLDNFDISAMELALVDPAGYLAAYPTLTDYQQRGDINQDGSFNNFDIGAFEQMLMGSN